MIVLITVLLSLIPMLIHYLARYKLRLSDVSGHSCALIRYYSNIIEDSEMMTLSALPHILNSKQNSFAVSA